LSSLRVHNSSVEAYIPIISLNSPEDSRAIALPLYGRAGEQAFAVVKA